MLALRSVALPLQDRELVHGTRHRAVFAMQGASIHARTRGGVEIGPLHLLAALVDSPDAHAIPGLADADLDALRSEAIAALDG